MVAPSSLPGESDPLFRPAHNGATFLSGSQVFRIGAKPTIGLSCLYFARENTEL
jgi:hypothetical protein